MQKTWLKQYPAGVPAEIDVNQYESLVALLEESFKKYASKEAYSFMGKSISYKQIDDASRALAAYLQSIGLERGDRVACMMPNVPQYPVACAGDPARRAGGGQRQSAVHAARARAPAEGLGLQGDRHPRELRRHVLQQVYANVPTKKVVLAAMGDMLGFPKGNIVNYVVRKVKKMVPAFDIPGAVRFNDALAQGRGKQLHGAEGRPRRHRGAAVHRRHHRRQQGRGAAASQPRGQRAAVRSLVPAGAEEGAGRRAGGHHLRAAASITSSASTRT